ncbi:MAG TPA: hypothetical protein PKC98_16665, partial [Candidatus Melainabacteria bacterium]|nr:hypothetical protein [Candidatus Melainabacteria bacterium]
MTCLLDLLFVMVFVALLLQESAEKDTAQNGTISSPIPGEVYGLEDPSKTLEELSEELEEKDKSIAELLYRIQSSTQTLSSLEAELEEREASARELSSKLNDQTETISNQVAGLQERDATINSLKARIEAAASELEQTRRSLAISESKLQEQQQQMQKAETESRRTDTAASSNELELLGVWKQEAENRGRWNEMGRYIVFKNRNGVLRMAALSQSRESGIDHTTGISDVRFEGGQ